jgi:hypothetical protein
MALNPYAAPSAHGGPHGYGAGTGSPVTLRGDVLIVPKNAALPNVCMKCGTQENIVRRTAKFSWTPIWARFSILICTVVGLVVIAITTKRGQLSVPLCTPCNARWSSAVVALIAGVVALIAGIMSFSLFDEPAIGAVLFFVSLAGCIGLGVGVVKPRMLQVHKIDDHVIELKGCNPIAARVIVGGH